MREFKKYTTLYDKDSVAANSTFSLLFVQEGYQDNQTELFQKKVSERLEYEIGNTASNVSPVDGRKSLGLEKAFKCTSFFDSEEISYTE